MRKIFKLVLTSVFGLSAGQTVANVSLEEEMFKDTMDQGTIDAAESFLQSCPDSAHAEDIDLLMRDILRETHRASVFTVSEPTYQIATNKQNLADLRRAFQGSQQDRREAFQDRQQKRREAFQERQKGRDKAQREKLREAFRERQQDRRDAFRERQQDRRDAFNERQEKRKGGGY